jgi:hypothetical protein
MWLKRKSISSVALVARHQADHLHFPPGQTGRQCSGPGRICRMGGMLHQSVLDLRGQAQFPAPGSPDRFHQQILADIFEQAAAAWMFSEVE